MNKSITRRVAFMKDGTTQVTEVQPSEILKRQAVAEAYGMGDIRVGLHITGEYPNAPALAALTRSR